MNHLPTLPLRIVVTAAGQTAVQYVRDARPLGPVHDVAWLLGMPSAYIGSMSPWRPGYERANIRGSSARQSVSEVHPAVELVER
eukprot:3195136-Pyramimonas_sp.AAC.2